MRKKERKRETHTERRGRAKEEGGKREKRHIWHFFPLLFPRRKGRPFVTPVVLRFVRLFSGDAQVEGTEGRGGSERKGEDRYVAKEGR